MFGACFAGSVPQVAHELVAPTFYIWLLILHSNCFYTVYLRSLLESVLSIRLTFQDRFEEVHVLVVLTDNWVRFVPCQNPGCMELIVFIIYI